MMRTSSNGRSDSVKKGYERKVPESARYANTQAKVSTGRTQAKVRYLTNREVLRRRDETFLRIAREDLAELFEESAAGVERLRPSRPPARAAAAGGGHAAGGGSRRRRGCHVDRPRRHESRRRRRG